MLHMLRLGLQECLIIQTIPDSNFTNKIYNVNALVVSIARVLNIPLVIHSG